MLACNFFPSKYLSALTNLLMSKTSSCSPSSDQSPSGDLSRVGLSFSIWLVRMFLSSLMKTSSSRISFSLLSVMYWFSFMKSCVRKFLASSSRSISSRRANCMLMLSSWYMPSGSLGCFRQPSSSSKMFFQAYWSTPSIFLPCSTSSATLVSSLKLASSTSRRPLTLLQSSCRMASLVASRKSRLSRQQFWKVSLPGESLIILSRSSFLFLHSSSVRTFGTAILMLKLLIAPKSRPNKYNQMAGLAVAQPFYELL